MTNTDAERVSDIVVRLRALIIMDEVGSDNPLGRDAADIIEAQSKALAEASPVLRDIAAERERQKSVEGWTAEHDNGHDKGELAQAAAAYAFYCTGAENGQPSAESLFPTTWSDRWWKPAGARRNLVKAAALIVAEIERLDRLTPTPENPNG